MKRMFEKYNKIIKWRIMPFNKRWENTYIFTVNIFVHKNDLKMSLQLNMIAKIINVLKENRKTLCELRVDEDFLEGTKIYEP